MDASHVFGNRQATRRVLDGELGRWSRRDPLEYVDGMGLYEYGYDAPTNYSDPLGLGNCKVLPFPENPNDPDPIVRKCNDICRTSIEADGRHAEGVTFCNPQNNNTGTPVCCICPIVTAPLVPKDYLKDVRDCIDIHESCHLRQGCPIPPGGSKESACRELPCYDEELGCLSDRKKACKDRACKTYYEDRIKDKEKTKKEYAKKCSRVATP